MSLNYEIDAQLRKFHCELCTEIFSSENNLLTHKSLKHDISFLNDSDSKLSDDLSKDFKKSKSDQQKSIQDIKIIEKEEIVNKESEKMTGMPKNLVNDNLDLEYDCAICSKQFKLEENLRRHIKMYHHFPCRFCSKTFSEKKFLDSHLKVCIEKIKNGENIKQKTDCENQIPELKRNSAKIYHFECKHCNQKFSSDFQLKIHVKLGSGDPIQCTKCTFKACTARGIDIHDKKCKKSIKRKNENHTQNPEMKKFKIGTNDINNDGDKSYENSEINSNQCFAPRKKLEIDEQSNHFNCNACDAEYTLRGNLIKHIETVHEGIRYNCPFCEFNVSKK